MLVHFYGIGPSEFRSMTLGEFEVFVAYRKSYLEAMKKAGP